MTQPNLEDQLSQLRIDKGRKSPVRRRGRLRWIVLPVLAVLIAYGGFRQMNAAVSVQTARVEKETVVPGQGPALVTASGYVVPRHNVEVSSKIMGRIVEMNIRRGDYVNAGDVLIRIEDDDFKARVLSAESQVATLRARLAELRAGSRPQEIQAANAAVASAQASLKSADLDLQRLEALVKQGAVSKQELDRARAARDVAAADLDSRRSTAELLKIGTRKEQIEAAEAQLREAEANLELTKTELGYTVIHAPISGTILEKLADVGELVTNTNFGGTRGAKNSVVTMADIKDLQVEVDLNESELPKVKPGQAATVRLDINPEKAYAGEVDEIAPQGDRQKGSIQVKVRVKDPDDLIRPELNARVTFLGDAEPEESAAKAGVRLWIPKSAVVQNGSETTVFVIENGMARSKRVTLGLSGEKGVSVAEGLTGDETLIVSPPKNLKEEARVAAAS
ncbi:MAG: efflux RND transporter periplasmic adaptor subunit [Candidatus Hydrogenedentes bacterium]|nr:efflux RND transporter periplasmic adaptor subunit [Candidatus Hydrogenedentota bacterium]